VGQRLAGLAAGWELPNAELFVWIEHGPIHGVDDGADEGNTGVDGICGNSLAEKSSAIYGPIFVKGPRLMHVVNDSDVELTNDIAELDGHALHGKVIGEARVRTVKVANLRRCALNDDVGDLDGVGVEAYGGVGCVSSVVDA